HARKDRAIGLEHRAIAGERRLDVAIEGVRVLHRELAAAHYAESRPALVAELRLDVIEVLRQLLVAAQLVARDVGHHLLRGGLHDEVAFVAILHAHQLGPAFVPPARLDPQLGRLDDRHQQLDRTRAVHLLAHDRLDLPDHAQPERHVRIDAAGDLADHAGARHQPMTDDFGVGRRFLLRGQVELGGFHAGIRSGAAPFARLAPARQTRGSTGYNRSDCKRSRGAVMLDRDGYRPNVGIILVNSRNSVFWGKRIREHSWQFPQGGIKRGESPEQAMFRELHEEVGLHPHHVRVVGRTRDWLRYEVPEHWVRREWRGHYRGQKQIWFLVRLVGRDSDIDLRASS